MLVTKIRQDSMSVYSNILKQMNAKMKMDLYRLDLQALKTSMICGVDVVNEGSNSILGFSASYNSTISQYFNAL
jgi:hypothetical protein